MLHPTPIGDPVLEQKPADSLTQDTSLQIGVSWPVQKEVLCTCGKRGLPPWYSVKHQFTGQSFFVPHSMQNFAVGTAYFSPQS